MKDNEKEAYFSSSPRLVQFKTESCSAWVRVRQCQASGVKIIGRSVFSRVLPAHTFYRHRLFPHLVEWHPTPVLLPGKSHGQRSLAGCSPWGHEESDKTERLHFHFSLLCIGEGNGSPLQCSCLENPRDGVAQSRTRLK